MWRWFQKKWRRWFPPKIVTKEVNPTNLILLPAPSIDKPKKFRVLSLDGGGIRGLIEALIATEIEIRTGKSIADLFDLVVGTSTGALLALGLTIPHEEFPGQSKFSAETLLDLYEAQNERIFSRSFSSKYLGEGWDFYGALTGLGARLMTQALVRKYPSRFGFLSHISPCVLFRKFPCIVPLLPPLTTMTPVLLSFLPKRPLSSHAIKLSSFIGGVMALASGVDWLTWKRSESVLRIEDSAKKAQLDELPNKYFNYRSILGISWLSYGIVRKILDLSIPYARYSSKNLEDTLQDYFAEARLGDTRTKVVIPSYSVRKGKPVFFRSYDRKDMDVKARDAARASSAAPTFFKPVCKKGDCLVDGGVFANNPAIHAYIEATRFAKREDIVMVSLGTGKAPISGFQNSPEAYEKYNALYWGIALLQSMTNTTVPDAIMNHLLHADQYFRIQVDLPRESRLDDTSARNIQDLREVTEDWIDTNPSVIDRIITQIT